MRKSWTQQEIQYLKDNWNRTLLELIMEKLDRTEDSIMRKARRLGLDVRKAEDDMVKKRWSCEEDSYILEKYKVMSSEDISRHLNRSITAVRKRALALGAASEAVRWSPKEEEFLKEKWGILDIETIAKKLKRSKNSVLLRAYKLSLKEQVIANGTYLTPKDISTILGVNLRTLYSWLCTGKMRHKKFKVGKKMKYQVTVEDFCSFLKENQDKWNSQRADMRQIKLYYVSHLIRKNNKISIYEELPEWLLDKLNRDKNGFREPLKPWTTKEEQELFHMIKQKYRYEDICTTLGRSIASVKTKFYILNKQDKNPGYIECKRSS